MIEEDTLPRPNGSEGGRRRLRLLAMLLTLGVLAWVISSNRDALRSLAAVPVTTLLVLAILQVGVLVATSWRHLVALRASGPGTIGAWRWYRIFVLGRFFNLVAPQVGNVYRAVVLKRDVGVSYTSFAAALFLFLWASTVLNLFAGAAILAVSETGLDLAGVPASLFLLVAGFALIALVPAALAVTSRLGGSRMKWFRSRLAAALDIAHNAVRSPSFSLHFTLTWLVGLAISAVVYLVSFEAVGIGISLASAVAMYALVQISTIVVITPGNLGIQELGLAAIAALFGHDFAGAALAAVLFRTVGLTVLALQAVPFGAMHTIRRVPSGTP